MVCNALNFASFLVAWKSLLTGITSRPSPSGGVLYQFLFHILGNTKEKIIKRQLRGMKGSKDFDRTLDE